MTTIQIRHPRRLGMLLLRVSLMAQRIGRGLRGRLSRKAGEYSPRYLLDHKTGNWPRGTSATPVYDGQKTRTPHGA